MDAALLWPGEERCVMLPSKDGRHQIEYSYRTERGALFECVCKDAEEAHRLCGPYNKPNTKNEQADIGGQRTDHVPAHRRRLAESR